MKRFPSELSPRIATKAQPGFTRRESYSTLVTLGSPLRLRSSAPSSRCWKVIARNYRARGNRRFVECWQKSQSCNYQRHYWLASASGYIILMSTGTGSAKCRCAQCEQPESACQCEKYCCLCQSVIDVRLCTDGLFYCEPCRTACDYKTSD